MLYTWHPVSSDATSKLQDGKIIEVDVADRKIAILRKGEQLFAFAATCPHAGARLCEGWIDPQGRIVCHLHSYRFDPANGRNTSGEGYKLRTFPVERREDLIFIGLVE
jgi:3-phenylpropionate/trans-cinnamate dioxygenase ferredoxin subunit